MVPTKSMPRDVEDKALRAQANLRELDNVQSFAGQCYGKKEPVVIGLSSQNKLQDKEVEIEKEFVKAAETGDISTINKFIVKNRCNINCMVSSLTALIAASANGQFFVVKALLENKSCDINLQNRNGVNALIAASCGGHLSIVNLLINRKCDLDGQSFDGNSALMDAFQKGHIAIAVALTNAGCNANLVNKKGRTAMEILINRHPSLVASFHDALDASKHGVNASPASKSEKRKIEMISNPIETVKRKIVMTSNPTPTSVSDGERPRAYTTYGPSVHRYDCDEDEENVSHKNKKVKEVISVSPGPVIVNISDKASSLIAATRSGDFNQVKNALKANPDLINCTDRDGMTALVWASMKNYMDIVELLLTYEDCQLDHQDRFGTTGLILACCSGHIEIALKLLQHACDHTVRDGKGKSAYDYLRSYHPTKCTSFLDALKV